MDATLNIKLELNQILALFQQLDKNERTLIFEEFPDEWLTYHGLTNVIALSFDEYNKKLEQGINDYKNGNTLNHEQMRNEIAKWKNQKF